MVQGLFSVRQYFNALTTEEDSIRNLATQIIEKLNGIGIEDT